MLEVVFKKLLQAVLLFPMGHELRLAGYPDYVVDKTCNKLGYIDPVSGVPNLLVSLGYVTTLTYLYCCDVSLQFRLEQIKDKLHISPVCGELLYSQIPNGYAFCLGMTGTLDCLSHAQFQLLQEYAFEHRTFLPSTLNKKQIQRGSLEVVHGSWDEFFLRVRSEIVDMLKLQRAMLIIFHDSDLLKQFATELNIQKPNLPQHKGYYILSDEMKRGRRTS
ncbi:hypothetical protein GUITHDRAFT_119385 [Guillardia theta CCMP2712]|uniref:Uncharacterized protein n=1 Tax=Guillardia theta (strain CCMP2712) TaxID=905079 RepID=L1IEE6_GUITC|nr:hypothetical protein GUITHDRAFT_119385 [Guillardia theta CCMP2712]EKX34462.1 hypothetical protein GUITHDRAFT_119385 [Guillardia theta CCMP2712]|eukprot:XP_005821442.1 hypothetical protein GUITHDRAFT_119385 [Guillardia theta CCMP2712]